MPSTFERVAAIISSTSDVPVERITLDSHVIKDLEIDSLAFLDVAFSIDQDFGIQIPIEKWTENINEGKASTNDYFVMRNLCEQIDRLVAAAESAAA